MVSKLLYVQLHRHLSTELTTLEEKQISKCMLLWLIQTRVTLAIIKRKKVTILKDYGVMDILKEVDVEDYDSTISEEVAELNDFRKKIGISILFHETFSFREGQSLITKMLLKATFPFRLILFTERQHVRREHYIRNKSHDQMSKTYS